MQRSRGILEHVSDFCGYVGRHVGVRCGPPVYASPSDGAPSSGFLAPGVIGCMLLLDDDSLPTVATVQD